jgi:hypothetical protein
MNEPLTFVVKQEDMTNKALLMDEALILAIDIVSQPDLYVVMRTAGVKGISESRLHRNNARGSLVVLTEQGEGDDVVITMFDNYKTFLNKWADEFIGSAEAPVANYIPPEIGLEEFMLTLHAIDSFRRVTYQNLLDYVYVDNAYVRIPEFTKTMAGSLASFDIRWLLPAFMAVTPGIEQYNTNLEAKNIEVLMTHKFFTEGMLGSGEEVLVFGEAGQVMGLEFLHSWLSSIGFEINVTTGEGFKAVEKLFVAPTVLTNHFVRLRDVGDDKAMVNHQTYIREQLLSKLNEVFEKAGSILQPVQTMEPTAKTIPNSAQTVPAISTPKFCNNCGTKLEVNAVFCFNCGKKINY